MRCISIVRSLYFKIFLANFFITFLSPEIYYYYYYLSPLCRVFTHTYLKQTMFLGYVVLQLFCSYK
jgi:hypothetical protein